MENLSIKMKIIRRMMNNKRFQNSIKGRSLLQPKTSTKIMNKRQKITKISKHTKAKSQEMHNF